jgi:hypothetical protein
MKNRPARWSLLILPVVLLLALSCAKDSDTVVEPEPSRAVSATGAPTQTAAPASTAQTAAKAKQCPRESPEFYIYVDPSQAAKVKKVTPFNAEVCPEQEVFWISSNPSVAVKPVWKEMVVPPGGQTPGQIVPCANPSPRCGGAKFPLPPGNKIRYVVEVFGNGPTAPPTETIDPQLEILP